MICSAVNFFPPGISCPPLVYATDVLSALARAGNECRRAGRLFDFVATIPLQVSAQGA